MSAQSRYRAASGVVAAVLLAVVGAWILISGAGESPVEASTSSQSPTASGQPSADTQEDTDLSLAEQPDAKAPRSIGAAKRPGVSVDPDLAVSDRSFGSAAEYDDGLRVQIAGIENTTIETVGPGALVGPVSVFDVKVTSGSTSPIDFSTVVVTAVYGDAPRLLADPCYDLPVRDLAGTLKPGGSMTARYAFFIPADARGDVELHVDLDGKRVPAVFSGTTQR